MKATKRKFKPNVFKKRVYSEILDEMIRFHITTSALRSIDKVGGLDNYLLNSRHVTDGEGLAVKKRILKVLKAKSKCETSSLVKEKATEKEEHVEESKREDKGISEIDEARPMHETSNLVKEKATENKERIEESKREDEESSKRDEARPKHEPSSLVEEKAVKNEEHLEESKNEDEESSKRGE
jgi:large subunit ribosomal protein L28